MHSGCRLYPHIGSPWAHQNGYTAIRSSASGTVSPSEIVDLPLNQKQCLLLCISARLAPSLLSVCGRFIGPPSLKNNSRACDKKRVSATSPTLLASVVLYLASSHFPSHLREQQARCLPIGRRLTIRSSLIICISRLPFHPFSRYASLSQSACRLPGILKIDCNPFSCSRDPAKFP
ncbi:hypothetical protein B0H14DRAFT_1603856 [Mycena olivaceomarginata]|nr:hypothetical protein B0H14DRAFT_1603856 [Mycena olivaceomarginata]